MRRIKRRKKRMYRFSAKQVAKAAKRNWGRILLTLSTIALIVFIGLNINSFLFASEYFNVSEVEVIDKAEHKLDYSLARIKDNPNIFKIDLKRIAKNIEREYSDIQKAIVRRVLPNKLVIEVLRRRPVAQIAIAAGGSRKKTFYFTVNKEAYILANIGTRPRRKLPVIYGIEDDAETIAIGHVYTAPNVQCALSFLEALQESGFSEHYPVNKIDVHQPRSMSFFIHNKLEVKIGNRNWKEKIENLAGILQNMDVDYSEDYYIDLRFKDFVFGKK